jgi:ATP-binding cassette subfamily A (ABC1) protein 3
LPLLAVFTGLVKKLLTEKELKIREGMKMMGMSNSSFYLSWVITYFILLLVIISTVSYIVVY